MPVLDLQDSRFYKEVFDKWRQCIAFRSEIDLDGELLADLEFNISDRPGIEQWVGFKEAITHINAEEWAACGETEFREAIDLLSAAAVASRGLPAEKIILVGNLGRMRYAMLQAIETLCSSFRVPLEAKLPLEPRFPSTRSSPLPKKSCAIANQRANKATHGFFSAHKANLRNAP